MPPELYSFSDYPEMMELIGYSNKEIDRESSVVVINLFILFLLFQNEKMREHFLVIPRVLA